MGYILIPGRDGPFRRTGPPSPLPKCLPGLKQSLKRRGVPGVARFEPRSGMGEIKGPTLPHRTIPQRQTLDKPSPIEWTCRGWGEFDYLKASACRLPLLELRWVGDSFLMRFALFVRVGEDRGGKGRLGSEGVHHGRGHPREAPVRGHPRVRLGPVSSLSHLRNLLDFVFYPLPRVPVEPDASPFRPTWISFRTCTSDALLPSMSGIPNDEAHH